MALTGRASIRLQISGTLYGESSLRHSSVSASKSGSACATFDDRGDTLAEPVVRHRVHRDLRDIGMGGDDALHLERVDVRSAADDDEFLPVDDGEPAVGVDGSDVAGRDGSGLRGPDAVPSSR